jgi:hypothetical protein
MVYHSIGLEQLSHAQIGKLLNGHRIRVKHGKHHNINASVEQHKKISKAHQKGMGATIQFDPYQIDEHQHLRGGSMMGGIKASIKKHAPKAIDSVAGYAKRNLHRLPSAIDNVAGYAKRNLHRLPSSIEYAQEHSKKQIEGLGVRKSRRQGHALMPAGYGECHEMHSPHGEAIKRKRGRPRKAVGGSMFGNIAKSVAKAVLPMAIDAASKYAKNKVAGSGARGRARGRGMNKALGRKILHGIEQFAPVALSLL